ncbi:MAG TPA: GH32 C-terminal domain-containing protein, partial [Gemmata sp.]|nr:GH32 C-terminal domain-containing protein [Gemmata sp.]
PDFKEKKQLWYGNFYAAQTFDNTPRGEQAPDSRVQIGWAQGVTFPGMPFNQQMTVPVHLRLSSTDGGRLVAMPSLRLGSLHEGDPVFQVNDVEPLKVSKEVALGDELDAFDLRLDLTVDKPVVFSLDLRGTKLTYDGKKGTLTCKGVTAPVKPHEGKLDVRVLVDRGSVEVFAGLGQTAMSVAAIPDEKRPKVILTPTEGEFTIRIARLYRMKSAWEK